MSRYLFILNPTAGHGNGAHILPTLRASLTNLGIAFDLVTTTDQGSAINLAQAAAESGIDVVVGVGGDGTANEVVNGLMRAREAGHTATAMGILGAGRGNDFAYSLRMPTDLAAACTALVTGRRRLVDIGHVTGGLFPEGRFFGNSLGVGFDAVVGIEAAKMTRLGGALSYLVAVLKTVFLYYRAPSITITLDDEVVTMPTLMLSIMNGQRQGGLFYMAPDARNDDALFDICLVEGVSRARIFTLIPHFFRGSQYSQKEIHRRQSATISLSAQTGALPAHLDGETLSQTDKVLTVNLLPQALPVIHPAGD